MRKDVNGGNILMQNFVVIVTPHPIQAQLGAALVCSGTRLGRICTPLHLFTVDSPGSETGEDFHVSFYDFLNHLIYIYIYIYFLQRPCIISVINAIKESVFNVV